MLVACIHYIYYFAYSKDEKYCDQSVCLFVCLSVCPLAFLLIRKFAKDIITFVSLVGK